MKQLPQLIVALVIVVLALVVAGLVVPWGLYCLLMR